MGELPVRRQMTGFQINIVVVFLDTKSKANFLNLWLGDSNCHILVAATSNLSISHTASAMSFLVGFVRTSSMEKLMIEAANYKLTSIEPAGWLHPDLFRACRQPSSPQVPAPAAARRHP